MKPQVMTWGGYSDRRCGSCRKKFRKGQKYVLVTPRGKDKAERRHYPRCPR